METKINSGIDLESTVDALLAAKERGEHVYCVFNGVTLHSDTVSMDSAYMEVTGYTRKEYYQRRKEFIENYKKEEQIAEQKAKENIPNWIERGQALIFPERYEQWKKCVQTCATNVYHGQELDVALDIMTALENGATMEEAKQIFDKECVSEELKLSVRDILFSFSSKGPEFCEATAYLAMSEENKELFEAKKQENIQLAENNVNKTSNHRL